MGASTSQKALKMAEINQMGQLELLLGKNQSLPSECHSSPGGETLLHWACYHGNAQAVRKILQLHHPVQLVTNENGYTALHLACESGYVEVISVLLEYGAAVSTVDKNKCIPLHYSLLNGYSDASILLLNAGSRLDTLDMRGFSCLHYACYSGNNSIVKHIINKYMMESSFNIKSILECRAEGGYTPLLCACHREYNRVDKEGNRINKLQQISHASVVDTLMQHGADLTACDQEGNTSLHIATIERQFEVAETVVKSAEIVLRKNFLSFINTKNTEGDTALHIACVQGQLRLAVMLIQAGADVFIIGTTSNEMKLEPIRLCPNNHMYQLTYAAMLHKSIYNWLGQCLHQLDPIFIASTSIAFKRVGIISPRDFSAQSVSQFTEVYLRDVVGVPQRGIRKRLLRLHSDVLCGAVSLKCSDWLQDEGVISRPVSSYPEETDVKGDSSEILNDHSNIDNTDR